MKSRLLEGLAFSYENIVALSDGGKPTAVIERQGESATQTMGR